MNIAIIGTGYVGLVSGVCFAGLGFNVTCIDINEITVSSLKSGRVPIFEPGLSALMERAVTRGNLTFQSAYGAAVSNADIVFLAVGTPMKDQAGEPDLSALCKAVDALAGALRDGAVVAVKSTVPVGTNEALAARIRKLRPGLRVSIASNPEFLREGSAVADFLHAERVVCGVPDDRSKRVLTAVYQPLCESGSKLVFTSPKNAELSKYAANAFLAMKISFINEVADVCELAGGDITDVAAIIGMDNRIGPKFLEAGPGFGGSCFPKDTEAFAAAARAYGVPSALIEAVITSNNARKLKLADRIIAALGADCEGACVAVLGVAFKPDTDDVRDAPALTIIPKLQAAGIRVQAHDPEAGQAALRHLHDVVWCDTPLDAAQDADAIVVLTEWDLYRATDLKDLKSRMRGRFMFDYRNIFSAASACAIGFDYTGIGLSPQADDAVFEVLDAEAIAKRDHDALDRTCSISGQDLVEAG